MADEYPFSWIREVGGVFRLGSGVLGKSAIAIGIFIVVGGLAVFRLHSDNAILIALGVIAVAFFLWFFPVLRFCEKYPAVALCDGAEWTRYQLDQMTAMGLPRDAAKSLVQVSPTDGIFAAPVTKDKVEGGA